MVVDPMAVVLVMVVGAAAADGKCADVPHHGHAHEQSPGNRWVVR
jgi:hypothetical protein